MFFNIKTFEDQNIFFSSVLEAKYKNYVFAGDIRSGKTIICLITLVIFCRIFPGSRWAVIRESRPKLVKTTLPTFFKYCCPPSFILDFNKAELIVTFKNKSQILFLSENIDHDPELTFFWGLEVNGFFLNQGDELSRTMMNMSVMRRGQWKIDPMPPAFTLIDANPTETWLKDFYDLFVQNTLPDTWYFQLADMEKNPFITQDYKDDLKTTLPVELYERFCKGNWDVVNAIMQLCSWEAIRSCKDKIKSNSHIRYLGIDVGHDGNDPTVWTIIEGDNILEELKVRLPKTKTVEVTRKTEQIILEERIDPENVCIDAVGVGAGVCDELEEKGYNVIQFKGGRGCDKNIVGTSLEFANHRSWSCWLLAEEIRKHRLGGLNGRKLISEAGAIKYKIRNDKNILIESKDDLRKKLRRSTDDWDSLTYANWARMQEQVAVLPGLMIG